MTEEKLFYEKHVFCCVNKRDSDCCANKNAEEMHAYFKKKCQEENLKNIRINKSGCLGRCKYGKVMVIYPDSVWYHYDNEKDIDLIIESHFKLGKIVKELKLNNSQI